MPDTLVSVGIEPVKPPPTFLERLPTNALIEGAPSKDWWARQSADAQFRFSTAVRTGLAQNLTTQKIASLVRGQMEISTRAAMALVRTSIQQVAADARRETFQRNKDLLAGIKHISTFDERTTDICISYGSDSATGDGAEYNLQYEPIHGTQLPFNGGVPRHWGCRSVEVAITKTFAELGHAELQEPEPASRAVKGGTLPAQTTFDAWLRAQSVEMQNEILGVGRADLWRAGRISLTQLLDQNGNAMTLAQLQEKYLVRLEQKSSPRTAPSGLPRMQFASPKQDRALSDQDFGSNYAASWRNAVEWAKARGNANEAMRVLDNNGETIFEKKGGKVSITLSPQEVSDLVDASRTMDLSRIALTSIHNHPGPGDFSVSAGDINTALATHTRREMAVAYTGSIYQVDFFDLGPLSDIELMWAHSIATGQVGNLLLKFNTQTALSVGGHLTNAVVDRIGGFDYQFLMVPETEQLTNTVVQSVARRLGVKPTFDAVVRAIARSVQDDMFNELRREQ